MTKARTLADNFAADINAVTADAPLTGGGTSGTVTVGIQAGTTAQSGAVQLTDSTASTSTTTAATPNSVKSAYDLANGAIAKSTIDAKGDLLVGSANDTVSRLAVASTAGYVLTVDSAEATGLKWAALATGTTFSGCLLHNNDTFQSISNNTWTSLTFSTELFDTDGYHSTSTNTSRITIPSGKNGYHLFYAGGFSFGGASGVQGIAFWKNGARIISGQDLSAVFSNQTSGARPTAIFALDLVATDYVEVKVLQQAGSTQDTSGNQFFGSVFLGA